MAACDKNVIASAPQELVFTHIAELIIRDPRSVVSMAQSIIIIKGYSFVLLRLLTISELR